MTRKKFLLLVTMIAAAPSVLGCGSGQDNVQTPKGTAFQVTADLTVSLDESFLPISVKELVQKSSYTGQLTVTGFLRWPMWATETTTAGIAEVFELQDVDLRQPFSFSWDLSRSLTPGGRIWLTASFTPSASSHLSRGDASSAQGTPLGVEPDSITTTGLCRYGCVYSETSNCDHPCDVMVDRNCTATCTEPDSGHGIPVIAYGDPNLIPIVNLVLNRSIFEATDTAAGN